jgi:hypothetical protein
VALPVIEAEREGLIAFVFADRQAGCRIYPSGNQHNGFFLSINHQNSFSATKQKTGSQSAKKYQRSWPPAHAAGCYSKRNM